MNGRHCSLGEHYRQGEMQGECQPGACTIETNGGDPCPPLTQPCWWGEDKTCPYLTGAVS